MLVRGGGAQAAPLLPKITPCINAVLCKRHETSGEGKPNRSSFIEHTVSSLVSTESVWILHNQWQTKFQASAEQAAIWLWWSIVSWESEVFFVVAELGNNHVIMLWVGYFPPILLILTWKCAGGCGWVVQGGSLCVSFRMAQMCGGGGRPAAAGWYSFCNYCRTDRPLHSLSLGVSGRCERHLVLCGSLLERTCDSVQLGRGSRTTRGRKGPSPSLVSQSCWYCTHLAARKTIYTVFVRAF